MQAYERERDDASERQDLPVRGDGVKRDGAAERDDDDAPGGAIGELLAYLARGLVDRPGEVSVEEFEEDDGTIVLELCVGEDDYGKVIGRNGRTAQALRTVVRAAATHEKRRVLVDIVD
jgi:predicted RNA-binding protein YlqC (UPF0109 family)